MWVKQNMNLCVTDLETKYEMHLETKNYLETKYELYFRILKRKKQPNEGCAENIMCECSSI